jgi:O-methyltransferase involved in polyketide biosynthesis
MKSPAPKHNNKISVASLTDVPETMLIPLYFKAKETLEHGEIKDEKAVAIVSSIDYDFSKFDQDAGTQTGVVVRTWLFDKILHDLYEKIGDKLVVVNLGAGLDTRQERFPHIKWYQLDLPESIAIRKQFFDEDPATLISKSLLDFSWMDDVKEKEHVLFIGEGLFMYFKEEDVKAVFKNIGAHFSQSYLAFNPIPKPMVGADHKSVDTTRAPMLWGILSLQEVIDWNAGWKVLISYYPPDYFKKRWEGMKLLSFIPGAKKSFVIAVLETER